MYKTNDDFRLFCCQINALGFLPINQVTDGMIHVKDTVPEEAETLLEYFYSKTSGQFRLLRHNGLTFRHTLPTFHRIAEKSS